MWLYKLKTWLHNLSKQKQNVETTCLTFVADFLFCSGKMVSEILWQRGYSQFSAEWSAKGREGKGREGKGREGNRWREVLGSHFTTNSCNSHIINYNMLYVCGSPNIPSHILNAPAAPQCCWTSVKGGAHMHFVDIKIMTLWCVYEVGMCFVLKL